MPRELNSILVASVTLILVSVVRYLFVKMPPNNTPATKNKLQISFFQLYLKNSIFPGIQAAQICLSDDEIPKVLFAINNDSGTINPIMGPETYHGHGCLINSIMTKMLKSENNFDT